MKRKQLEQKQKKWKNLIYEAGEYNEGMTTPSTQYLSIDVFQEKLEKQVIPEMTVLLWEEIQAYNQKCINEYA